MHRTDHDTPATSAPTVAHRPAADSLPAATGGPGSPLRPATPSASPEAIYDEVAYAYDGTLEGLLSAIFAAYERRENPTDVVPESRLQPAWASEWRPSPRTWAMRPGCCAA